jgi:arsenate reductase
MRTKPSPVSWWTYTRLSRGARIPTYLPLLATRFARDRLRAAGIIEGLIMTDKPEVLFVCVHNAGRSQMAAGLLRQLAAGRVLVRSAGSAPADTINPVVVEAMAEKDIDITEEFPKPLTTEAVQASDVVITMGCGDACPVFPGKRYLDWKLEDPAGQDIDTVRRIRDDIEAKVQQLLAELLPTAPAP